MLGKSHPVLLSITSVHAILRPISTRALLHRSAGTTSPNSFRTSQHQKNHNQRTNVHVQGRLDTAPLRICRAFRKRRTPMNGLDIIHRDLRAGLGAVLSACRLDCCYLPRNWQLQEWNERNGAFGLAPCFERSHFHFHSSLFALHSFYTLHSALIWRQRLRLLVVPVKPAVLWSEAFIFPKT